MSMQHKIAHVSVWSGPFDGDGSLEAGSREMWPPHRLRLVVMPCGDSVVIAVNSCV